MAKLITETELAEWFVQSVLTIRRVRTTNPERHPPFIRIGSSVRYDVDEVKRWLDSKTVNAMDAPAPAPVPTPKDKRPKAAPISHPREKRRPGRPPKTETVRKTKNAGK
jgi:predicted DNA-binding transcriptional regulator AlpA